jgi:transposase
LFLGFLRHYTNRLESDVGKGNRARGGATERFFARLHNFRGVVTRWERHVDNYLGMVQLACARILLRHL